MGKSQATWKITQRIPFKRTIMDAFYQYSIKTLILLAVTLLIRFFAGKAVTRFLSKFEGELIDLSFFFMYIRSAEGHLVTIPNSAVLNKTVIIKSNSAN